MKVNPNNYNAERPKADSLPQRRVISQFSNNQDSVSFGSFKSGVSKYVNKIAGGNFFTEFLIVDTLSMISPRVWIGLNRDKDKTGEYNLKAGAEEAGRELFSGPSIFLIPMAVLSIIKHYAPASHIPHETLYSFNSIMNEVTQKANPGTFKDKSTLDKKFAQKIFDKSFGDFDLKDKGKLKSEFVNLLTGEKSKAKNKEFEELVIRINNSNKKCAPINSKTVEFENLKMNTFELFEDFHNYSKDIINKITQRNFDKKSMKNYGDNVKEFLEKIRKSRATTKTATAIAGFLAVGSFLLILPKLVQVDKTSPAMESAKRARKEGKALALASIGGADENK